MSKLSKFDHPDILGAAIRIDGETDSIYLDKTNPEPSDVDWPALLDAAILTHKLSRPDINGLVTRVSMESQRATIFVETHGHEIWAVCVKHQSPLTKSIHRSIRRAAKPPKVQPSISGY